MQIFPDKIRSIRPQNCGTSDLESVSTPHCGRSVSLAAEQRAQESGSESASKQHEQQQAPAASGCFGSAAVVGKAVVGAAVEAGAVEAAAVVEDVVAAVFAVAVPFAVAEVVNPLAAAVDRVMPLDDVDSAMT